MSVHISSKPPLKSAEAVESIDDLLIEILLKLPLRSLMRFKFASPRWYSIIINRVLVLLRNPCPNPAVGVFYHAPRNYEYNYLHLDSKTQKKYPSFMELPFRDDDPARAFWIHQSCNGLLLCCSSTVLGNFFIGRDYYSIGSCYVYNPTTKDFARLPKPGICDGVPTTVFTVNLAFDPCKSPFYKAVCFKESKLGAGLLNVEVYSVETNAWRSTGKTFGLRYTCHDFSHGVYWNSSINWINHLTREVLYYNVDEERFRKIPLPADLIRVDYFGESCGHLHVVSRKNTFLNVYEMRNDYSEWFVKYQVYTTLLNPEFWFRTVLCLTCGHEGTFVFLGVSNSVVRYDLASKSCMEISRLEFDMLVSRHVVQYIESVASV